MTYNQNHNPFVTVCCDQLSNNNLLTKCFVVASHKRKVAGKFSAVEDKRLKLMMEIEDRREEREAKARLEERKQEQEHQVVQEVSALLENRKHEERIMQIMLAMHQTALAMQMPQSVH